MISSSDISQQNYENLPSKSQILSMKFGEKYIHQSLEIELYGILQKKNKKNFYQNRYIRTNGCYLQYWSSYEKYLENPTLPSSSYDIRDIKLIEMLPDITNNIFVIQFMNKKFQLILKGISYDNCIEWIDFLNAKRSLYSTNSLLLNDDSITPTLKTQTFLTILKLSSDEQDHYINDLMNDIFDMVYDDQNEKKAIPTSPIDNHQNANLILSSDAKATLHACKSCLEDFTVTCDECALEMASRVPQVVAQCRDYMRRYAELFKSRISLELNPYFSVSIPAPEIHNHGDECLIEAICFFQSLDTLRKHKFLPRTFFSSIREALYSADQLSREFLRLLVLRNEMWFHELTELQPRQRGQKLCEYYKIVDYQIQKIDEAFVVCDLYDMKSKQTLLMMTIDTLAISMARLVGKTTFAGYGEEALLGHILACQECVRYFSTLKLTRATIYDDKDSKPPTSLRVRSDSFPTEELVTESTNTSTVLALSRSCIEQLGTIFLQSAANAATGAVHNMLTATQDIVNMFLNEKDGGWIGGKVCTVYLDRITSWMDGFCQRGSSKPCEFHRIVRRETIRSVVVTYFRKLIEKYRSNKRFILSIAGETQVANDLKMIGRWVETQNEKLIPFYVQDRGSYTGSNDVTTIIKSMRMFITSDESNLMLCFVESIQHFGIASAPHLYDLARLSLKIRSDLTRKSRLYALSCFSSYIEQLGQTSPDDLGPLTQPHPRLSGPDILSELCPRVGSYHCTGKKWSYELSDNNTKLEMANLVTDACNVARIRRLGFKETTSKPSIARPRENSTEYDGWQLLDPDSIKLSMNPLDDPQRSTSLQELYGGKPAHRRLTSVNDAIDNISILDNQASDNETTSVYSYDNKRPLIDLYGCCFEELHMSLCPPMYLRNSSRKYIFLSSIRPEDHAKMVSFDELELKSDLIGNRKEEEKSGPILNPVKLPLVCVSDNESELEPDSSSARGSKVNHLPELSSESDEEGSSYHIPSVTTMEEILPVPVESIDTLLPPAKPPKPRRYSIPKVDQLSSVNGDEPLDETSFNETQGKLDNSDLDIVDQWLLAQQQLPERCRLPSLSM